MKSMMMKRTMKTAMILAAAMGLALALGCAELQAELDNVNKELSKPSESGDATSTQQASSTEGQKSSETSSVAPASASSTQSQPSAPSRESEEAAVSRESEAITKIHVTLDGQKPAPDANGIYWVVPKPVSATPETVFTMDESLGELNMCILNIYLEENGRESGQPWAVTDYNVTPRLMAPGKAFNLANPGEGVTILSPGREQVKSCTFESGKSYIAIFTVSGSKDAWTTHVRFSVK